MFAKREANGEKKVNYQTPLPSIGPGPVSSHHKGMLVEGRDGVECLREGRLWGKGPAAAGSPRNPFRLSETLRFGLSWGLLPLLSPRRAAVPIPFSPMLTQGLNPLRGTSNGRRLEARGCLEVE